MALLFGGMSCARASKGCAEFSTRNPAQGNASTGCSRDQDSFEPPLPEVLKKKAGELLLELL